MINAATATAAAATRPASPAGIIRSWDAAYGSAHWLQACHDLTAAMAGRLGRGFHAAGPYERCADEFIGEAQATPRAAQAIERTLASGTILSTKRTGATAHVTVHYVVKPPVLPSKFPSRDAYTLTDQHGHWRISALGSV